MILCFDVDIVILWHLCPWLVMSFSYVLTDYMQSDLHKIIVSQQPLSSDHIKVFTYQILRGNWLHFMCNVSFKRSLVKLQSEKKTIL